MTVAEITQSNSQRKVSILGGDSISHFEKKCSYEHVSDGRSLPRGRERKLSESANTINIEW